MLLQTSFLNAILAAEPMIFVILVYFFLTGLGHVLWYRIGQNIVSDPTAEVAKHDTVFKTLSYFVTGGFILPMNLGVFALSLFAHYFIYFINRAESHESH